MNPVAFLWLLLAITGLAAAGQKLVSIRRASILCRLARQWKMQYVCNDRFRLAERVSQRMPEIGPAHVVARNLIYQTESGRRRYLFTVDFCRGVVSGQRRRTCVMILDEPVGCADEAGASLRLAPDDLPLVEQYRRLREQTTD